MSRNAILWRLCVVAVLTFTPSATLHADDLETRLFCPDQQSSGSEVLIDLFLFNSTCKAVNARILSSIIGNSGDNLAGIGVFGPSVAVPSVTIPAASEVYYGCQAGSCEFHETPCVTNADCLDCRASIPSEVALSISVPPALPRSLEGTVATLLILTEVDGIGTGTSVADVAECFIDVK